MTEVICIVCPKGCHLQVDENNDYKVTGQSCQRGVEYGKAELLNPVRVLTSTVKLCGAALNRCPVRTSGSIPKKIMGDVMKEIEKIQLAAPVKVGQVVIPNVLDTGCDVIATRSIK